MIDPGTDVFFLFEFASLQRKLAFHTSAVGRTFAAEKFTTTSSPLDSACAEAPCHTPSE
jgi:hypothetical protein